MRRAKGLLSRISRSIIGRGRVARRRAASLLMVLGAVAGAILIASPGGCGQQGLSSNAPLEQRIMRVRIVVNVEQATLAASEAPLYFTTGNTEQRYLALPRNVPVPVTLTQSGWAVGNTVVGRGELILRPAGLGALSVNGMPHRGQYRFVGIGPGRFDVVNDVDIDDYLYSVLPRELFANWQDEAYRAQAVAARTYALYEKNVPRETRHWDVYADERSQVYGGLAAETAKSRAAVDATRGLVLTYGPSGDERIFKAYFSSCCGGVTMSVADVFREPEIPPLSAQAVGPLCSASTKYNWGPLVLGKDELTRRFRAFGTRRNIAEKDMAAVQSIEIAARNAYGRPTRYVVTDARGARYMWLAEDLRWAVNTEAQPGTTVFSSYVEQIVNDPAQIRFVGGHGYGHGVGMCQWCTEARARQGMGHEEILRKAYPGSKLTVAY